MRQQKYTQAQQVIDTLRTTGGYATLVKGTERSVYNDLHPKISQSLWNIISYTDVAQRAPQNETFTWV